MQVFIGNLPGEATLAQLDEFLGGLKLHSDARLCKGVNASDCSYHYFLAHASDRQQGQALIARFNGSDFCGRKIVAREFFDRRREGAWDGKERRINAAG